MALVKRQAILADVMYACRERRTGRVDVRQNAVELIGCLGTASLEQELHVSVLQGDSQVG